MAKDRVVEMLVKDWSQALEILGRGPGVEPPDPEAVQTAPGTWVLTWRDGRTETYVGGVLVPVLVPVPDPG